MVVLALPLLPALPAGAEKVTKVIPDQGSPSAIAVNEVTNKVYVLHLFGDDDVTVLDGKTNTVTTVDDPGGSGSAAVAVNPTTNKVYVVNQFSHNVSVLNGTTNAVITTVAVGGSPGPIVVNPVTNKIYVGNQDDGDPDAEAGSVSIIDGTTDAVTATVPTDIPLSLAANQVTNKIYVAGVNGVLTAIDGAGSPQTISIGTTEDTALTAVAVNPHTNRVYVTDCVEVENSSACESNTLRVVDGATNSVIASAPIPEHPRYMEVNPVTNTIYLASGPGAPVVIIDGATNSLTSVTLPNAAPGTSDLALNPMTNRAYVAAAGLVVIDGTYQTAEAVPDTGTATFVAVNTVTNKIYAADTLESEITVVDGATNDPTFIPVGGSPAAVAVNPVTNKIYSTDSVADEVAIVEGDTHSTVYASVGRQPVAIALNPVTNKVYVANKGNDPPDPDCGDDCFLVPGSMSVIDGATDAVQTIVSAGRPVAVAVNPVNNRIYFANQGGSVTLLDGATNAVTEIPTGGIPVAIATNPLNNKVYVAAKGNAAGTPPETQTGSIKIIDGATNAVTSIAAGVNPVDVAVNPTSNKAYVSNQGNSRVTIVDGITNAAVSVAVNIPGEIGVNPATNKVYVIHETGPGGMTVIDGATNTTSPVSVGSSPHDIAVNPATNKVYVAISGGSGSVQAIDGATGTFLEEVAEGSLDDLAVNLANNRVYAANVSFNNLWEIHEQRLCDIPLDVAIEPLPGNRSLGSTANFNFTASSNFNSATGTPDPGCAGGPASGSSGSSGASSGSSGTSGSSGSSGSSGASSGSSGSSGTSGSSGASSGSSGTSGSSGIPGLPGAGATPSTLPTAVFFQLDTWQGLWTRASDGAGDTFSGSVSGLTNGIHILYAYATDSQEATSVNTPESSPLVGNIAAYLFVVGAPPASFVKGPDQTVNEDAGAQSVAGWATSISATSFTVTNNNPALFSGQPAVSPTGTLTYTPAPNAFGSATVTVKAVLGSSTSAPQDFTITVTPVNDRPSFVKGPNQSVPETAGAVTVPAWAKSISPGPGEAGQTVTFLVTNNNNALFTVQPAISPTGTLTFATNPGTGGSATVSVRLQDNGGTANGGADITNGAQTFTIVVTTIACTIRGSGTIYGTGGNDLICGSSGVDNISGLGGDDTIYGFSGNDRLDGGPGHDRIFGGPGDDTLFGSSGNDTLNGEEGTDSADGSSGTDSCVAETRTTCES